MQIQLEDTVPSVDHPRFQLIEHVRSLLDRKLIDTAWEDGLLNALAMLATLPLTSREFGLAINRLHNARRYVSAQERGAARFELQLLLASLKNSNESRPIRRRLRNSKPVTILKAIDSAGPQPDRSR